jgi:hypothetical protein
MLEVKLTDRAGRGWDWEVSDEAGTLTARGRQRDRPAAKYQAVRALFQLLNVMSRRRSTLNRESNRAVDDRDALWFARFWLLATLRASPR